MRFVLSLPIKKIQEMKSFYIYMPQVQKNISLNFKYTFSLNIFKNTCTTILNIFILSQQYCITIGILYCLLWYIFPYRQQVPIWVLILFEFSCHKSRGFFLSSIHQPTLYIIPTHGWQCFVIKQLIHVKLDFFFFENKNVILHKSAINSHYHANTPYLIFLYSYRKK